jgi:hypothetical protein
MQMLQPIVNSLLGLDMDCLSFVTWRLACSGCSDKLKRGWAAYQLGQASISADDPERISQLQARR